MKISNLDFKPHLIKKMICVRLDEEEYKKVKKIAVQNKESVSETCRVIIHSVIKDIEQ